MKLLIESGLFGRGLVPISTPTLVKRYNACLDSIGQEPTGLKKFSIDAVGWSPEVAEEKGNVDYLALQAANRFAIILTPEQNGMSVHRPVQSFDRIAMEQMFHQAAAQIADITSHAGICLEFTHSLTQFREVSELLTVEWIDIKAHDTRGIMKAATKLRDLVSTFTQDTNAWTDSNLRHQIQQIGAEHGDLRFRSVNIPDLKFLDVRSYYTRAFGGVYVFRDFLKSGGRLLLMEDACPVKVQKGSPTYQLDDGRVPEILETQNVVEVPVDGYKEPEGQTYLAELQEYLLAESFYNAGEDENLNNYTEGKKRSWVTTNEGKLQPEYFELERLRADINRNVPQKRLKPLGRLRTLLFQPSKAAQTSDVTERVVLNLIARLAPENIERLFVRNKRRFYDLFQTWSEAKKKWAVEFLVKKGHPKPLHPQLAAQAAK
jgi:hypothetical protein